MGILYDADREAVINPWARYAPLEGCPKVVVSCFAQNLVEYVLRRHGGEAIAEVRCANGATPLYRLEDMDIGLTMASVGASRVVKQFRSKRIAHFFYAADNLDAKVWDPRKFTNTAGLDAKQAIAELALELGCRMAEGLA